MAYGADDNSMQAQLGLVQGGTTAQNVVQFPTPPPMPAVRHPGDFSRDIVQQTQTQAMSVMQPGMRAMSPQMGAVATYAQQFGANMNAINSQVFNPYVAQSMGQMGGAGGMYGGYGFQPGMLPNPAQMTPPNFGLFRAFPPHAAPSIPPTPPMPYIGTPFTPNLASPSFSTPMDYAYSQAQYRNFQNQAAVLTAPGIAGRFFTDLAGSGMGGGLGALLGASIGGARGAGIGGRVGALAGLLGSEAFGFGAASQRIIDRLHPMRSAYLQSNELQSGLAGTVVGGGDLDIAGRGLTGVGARNLAYQLRGLSRETPSSGENFTNTDLVTMTRLAGQQGILNMSQSSDEIFRKMKDVAKSMKVFMQLAGEPDMRTAMKQMSQLYQMGIDIPDVPNFAQKAKMYAKMAGTTFQGIMEAGRAGAEIFQANGLSAGLGMQIGMGSAGMARAAVAGRAYSPELLARLGGEQGVAQRDMMAQAATLRMPMMAAAGAQLNGAGGFGFIQDAARGMGSGAYNIHQLTTMGVNNLMTAVSRGGVGALGGYLLQEQSLQDQLGRTLGPEGIKNMKFQTILSTMKMLGLSGPNGAMMSALALNNGDRDLTAQEIGQMSSPEYFANMQRQLEVQRSEMRGLAKKKADDETPGYFARLGTGNASAGTVAKAGVSAGSLALTGAGIGSAILPGVGTAVGALAGLLIEAVPAAVAGIKRSAGWQQLSASTYEGFQNIGAAFDYSAENAAEKNGQTISRVSRRLLPTTDRQRREISRLTGDEVFNDFMVTLNRANTSGAYRDSSALGYTAAGEAYGSTWRGFKDSELKDEYNRVIRGRQMLHGIRNIGTSRQEMLSELDDAYNASGLMQRSMYGNASQMGEALSRAKDAGITSAQRTAFRNQLAAFAKRGDRYGQLKESEYQNIAKNVLGADYTVERGKMMFEAEAGMSKALSGEFGVEAFTPHGRAAVGREHDNFMTTARTRQEELFATMFGGRGDTEKQKQAYDFLYSQGPEVATYVSMTLASLDPDPALSSLSEDQFNRVRNIAKGMLEELGHPDKAAEREFIKNMGRRLSGSKTSALGLSKAFDKMGAKAMAGAQFQAGLEKLGIKVDSNDTPETLMAKMSRDTKFKGDPKLKSLLSRYTAAAKGPNAQAEVAALTGQFIDIVRGQGGGLTAVTATGGVLADEAGLDKAAADFGLTAAEASRLFKGGNPLMAAAVSLDYAANKLTVAADKMNN